MTGHVLGPLGVAVTFEVIEVDGATRLSARGPAPVIAAYLPIARYALHRLTTPER